MVTLPESSHIVHTEYETVFLHDQEVQERGLAAPVRERQA